MDQFYYEKRIDDLNNNIKGIILRIKAMQLNYEADLLLLNHPFMQPQAHKIEALKELDESLGLTKWLEAEQKLHQENQ